MSRIFLRSAGSSSPARRSGPGSRSSERSSPRNPARPARASRQVASRRGRPQDQRRQTLAVAGDRRERRRAGYPLAVASRHCGRKAVHAQALQALGPAAGDGDRQARILSGRESETRPRRRASPAQGDQQRGRSLAPAHPSTREDHGAVQVAATRPAVPVQIRQPPSSANASPPLRPFLPPRKTGRV